jgi:hypothetical protein
MKKSTIEKLDPNTYVKVELSLSYGSSAQAEIYDSKIEEEYTRTSKKTYLVLRNV